MLERLSSRPRPRPSRTNKVLCPNGSWWLSRSLDQRLSRIFAKAVSTVTLCAVVSFSAWSYGKLKPVRDHTERDAYRADLRWFELYCTKDYIAAHPWTPEELAGTTGYPPGAEPHGTQMNFRARRLAQEEA